MRNIKNVFFNYPTKDDYEFSIIPSVVIGKDCFNEDNDRTHYIGISWLFWGMYYYFK